MKVLLLLNEPYVAASGIAQYNRNVADALRNIPDAEIRIVCRGQVGIAALDKLIFGAKTLVHGFAWRPDLIFVGHINLVPLALGAARRISIPLVLPAHGIEVWDKPGASRFEAATRVTEIWPVSQTTQDRMRTWLPDVPMHIIPNCVELSDFTPGPKPAYLVERYGVAGKKVVMTLARLPGWDRHKGIDEMIQAMADLRHRQPDLRYLVAGEGPDKQRLIDLASKLGVTDTVIFAGFIDRAEKLDYYRLADAFAMPSRGEGFGIVFLESLACGVPVMGSRLDGGRDALLDGELGLVVDPGDREAVAAGIETTLSAKAPPREALDIYSFASFARHIEEAMRAVIAGTGMGRR